MSTNPNRSIRTLVRLAALAALVLGALFVAPPRAHACGMEAFYRRPPSRPQAPLLLAKAKQNLRRGRSALALSQATTVIGDERARPREKAQAYTVVGWVRWARGDQGGAIEALRRGRSIDAPAYETVLDEAQDPFLRSLIRKALAA